jgi:hypothetical protein
LVAYLVGGAFLSLAYFDLPYHFVITVVSVYIIVKKELGEIHAVDERKNYLFDRAEQ